MLETLNLTPFTAFHLAVGVLAVAAGLTALIRDKVISARNVAGKIYIGATVVLCLTGFGIYHHGGFGLPHAFGVLTLLILAFLALPWRSRWLGRASRYVEAVSFSAIYFVHMVAGFTELCTRLPPGAPLVADRTGPAVLAAIAIFFLLFLLGAYFQVRWLSANPQGKSAA